MDNKYFKVLKICSNTLNNCNKIFVLKNGEEPLIIKNGDQPLITLKNFTNKSNKFNNIVENSISKNTNIIITQIDNYIKIYIKQTNIIIIKIKKNDKDMATIDELDLRPLGFNIYGDNKTLHAGGNIHLSNCTFNSQNMINFEN